MNAVGVSKRLDFYYIIAARRERVPLLRTLMGIIAAALCQGFHHLRRDFGNLQAPAEASAAGRDLRSSLSLPCPPPGNMTLLRRK